MDAAHWKAQAEKWEAYYHRLDVDTIKLRDAAEKWEAERGRLNSALMTALGHSRYYARRAGYLEGGLQIIATNELPDPIEAAKRLLDGVGEDVLADKEPAKP